MNATHRRGRGGESGRGYRVPLFISVWLAAAACSGVDQDGASTLGLTGEDGETDTDASAPSSPMLVPDVIGDLECAEPHQRDATDQKLPSGTETVVPVPPGLTELLSAIRSEGARPGLQFDTSRAGELLNVRVSVRGEQIHRGDTGEDDAIIDLGALTVRLAHAASVGAWAGPEVVVPPDFPLDQAVVLKTYRRARTETGLGPAELAMLSVFDRRDERAGPVATLAIDARTALSRGLDCDARAYELAVEVPAVAVSFPPLSSCSVDECAKTKAAWLRANHDLWRIRQILDFIAASPEEDRAFLWSQEGASKKGGVLMSYESDDVGPNTALAYYFGPYAPYRLEAIRWAYAELWSVFQTHDIDGLTFDIECTPDAPGDICNTTEPGGHHAVKGNVKLCAKAYSTPSQAFDVPRLILHESMHHMFVPWRDDIARLSPVLDTHTHGHGDLCASKLTTGKGYGLYNIKHLADYRNDHGGDCYHSNFAFRNNDSFAYAAATIGTYIRFGFLDHWPLEQPPDDEDNFPPPECGQPGIDVPPPGFFDPLSECYKRGAELVCPGAHGGMSPALLDVAVICPEL